MFGHTDLQQMASKRLVVEQALHSENPEYQSEDSKHALEASFRLNMTNLQFKKSASPVGKSRALAVYNSETVIVDWHASADDWQRAHPEAFRNGTEGLTRILNKDLRPLNLSVLPCIGYVDSEKSVAGYVFQLPNHVGQTEQPVDLFELTSSKRDPRDIPDLGDCFKLANALVSTIFEIHILSWVHGNISARNIFFWSRDGDDGFPDVTRPYLLGFDISRPVELPETPAKDDSHEYYRHPELRKTGQKHHQHGFKPSYDLYSLGVVLYETGIWPSFWQNTERSSYRSYLRMDLRIGQKYLAEKAMKDLRRHVGDRYANIVAACLDGGFDRFNDDLSSDHPKQLRQYLNDFQTKAVNPLAAYST